MIVFGVLTIVAVDAALWPSVSVGARVLDVAMVAALAFFTVRAERLRPTARRDAQVT